MERVGVEQIELNLRGLPEITTAMFYQLFNDNKRFLFGTKDAREHLGYAVKQVWLTGDVGSMARGRRAEIRGRGGQRSAQLLDQRHRHLNVGRRKAAEGRRTPGRIRETRCSRLDFLAIWAKNPMSGV